MADAERSSRRSDRGSDRGRDRGRGRSSGGDNTAMRGVILVVIAACVGVFLLVKGDPTTGAAAGAPGGETTTATSTTTAAPEVPATALPAAQLPILAVNGAGSTDGKLASKTRTALAGKGFSNVKPADSKPKDAYAQTQVFFLEGFEGDGGAKIPFAQAWVLGQILRYPLLEDHGQALGPIGQIRHGESPGWAG